MAENTPEQNLNLEGVVDSLVLPLGGAYAQAMRALGQPVIKDPNGRAPFAINTDADRNTDTYAQVKAGIMQLASPYVEEYKKSFNKNPSQEELVSFLTQNVTPDLAIKQYQGMGSSQELRESIVKPSLKSNIEKNDYEKSQKDTLEESLKGSQDQYNRELSLIDQLTQEAQRGTRSAVEEAYGQELRRQATENSQMGRLSQPVYQENVNRQSQSFGQGLAKAIAGIQGQSLQSKAQANQSLADRLQQARQFAAGLGIQNRQLGLTERGQNIGQQNYQNQTIADMIQNQQNRADAYELGRRQADANKPGTLDYVNTAIGGLATLAGGVGAGMGLYDRLKSKKG